MNAKLKKLLSIFKRKRKESGILTHKVTAIMYDPEGIEISRQEGLNTVTTGDPTVPNHNGYVYILNRIFDDGTYSGYDPDDFVNKMQLGTGTPDNTGLGTPLTGVPSTTLIAFKSGYPTWDISTLAAPVITVRCEWDATFDALSGVTEAGLFADGVGQIMMAHKTFSPALSKTTGGTLAVEWEITLSA